MLKKTIKYEDFNGNEREEDLYFNLSKSELSAKALVDENIGDKLKEIIESGNNQKIFDVYERIVLASYGEKSDDGKFFRKSEEITNNFKQSAAYDALFMDLLDGDNAEKFINGILPTF